MDLNKVGKLLCDLRKSKGLGLSATWRYYDELLDIFPECEKYLEIIPKTTLINID